MVGKSIRLVWNYFKINLSSAFEYRVNFFLGTIGMFLNDIVWIFFWFILISKFSEINGWGFNEILQLYAIVTISWGISGIFFGNRGHLSGMIDEGYIDFYMTFPEDVLTHILCSELKLGAIGDLFFGIILAFFCISLAELPLFILLCLISIVFVIGYCILVGSIGFFIGSARAIERNLVMGLITFSTYPLAIFGGVAKFFLFTVIPAGLISGIPVQIMNDFNLGWLIFLLVFSIVFLLISIKIFNVGLKKYESGNLIMARM